MRIHSPPGVAGETRSRTARRDVHVHAAEGVDHVDEAREVDQRVVVDADAEQVGDDLLERGRARIAAAPERLGVAQRERVQRVQQVVVRVAEARRRLPAATARPRGCAGSRTATAFFVFTLTDSTIIVSVRMPARPGPRSPPSRSTVRRPLRSHGAASRPRSAVAPTAASGVPKAAAVERALAVSLIVGPDSTGPLRVLEGDGGGRLLRLVRGVGRERHGGVGLVGLVLREDGGERAVRVPVEVGDHGVRRGGERQQRGEHAAPAADASRGGPGGRRRRCRRRAAGRSPRWR